MRKYRAIAEYYDAKNENHPVLHADRESLDAFQIFRLVRDATRDQVDFPGVQGANYRATGDDSVGKRTAAMWAAIFDGKKTVT